MNSFTAHDKVPDVFLSYALWGGSIVLFVIVFLLELPPAVINTVSIHSNNSFMMEGVHFILSMATSSQCTRSC